MQATPDWREIMTAERVENEMRIKFEGPGLYLTDKDTMVAVPLNVSNETVWHKIQPANTKYDVLVFNCAWRDTIFSVIAGAPVRSDFRS